MHGGAEPRRDRCSQNRLGCRQFLLSFSLSFYAHLSSRWAPKEPHTDASARFNEPFESPRGPLTCGRDADQRCPGTGRRLNFSEIHEPAEFKDWVRGGPCRLREGCSRAFEWCVLG